DDSIGAMRVQRHVALDAVDDDTEPRARRDDRRLAVDIDSQVRVKVTRNTWGQSVSGEQGRVQDGVEARVNRVVSEVRIDGVSEVDTADEPFLQRIHARPARPRLGLLLRPHGIPEGRDYFQ